MMKKLLTIILITALLITPMQILSASENDESFISVSFEPGTRKINVAGHESLSEGSAVVIVMTEFESEISPDNPPIISEMVFVSDEGRYNLSAVVPESVENGKYTVYAGSDAREEMISSDLILFFPDSTETMEAISALNSAENYPEFVEILSEVSFDVGIELEAIESMSVFSKALWGVRETAGDFSASSIVSATSFAMGADVLAATHDIGKVMQNYASAYDFSYGEYVNLNSDIKETADSIFLKTPTDKGYISYAEIVSLSNLICAPSYGRLREIITSRPEVFGIEFSTKYNKLSANDKAKVFKMIFDERSSFMTTEDVSDSFEDAVESLSKSSSEGGGGGGGGGGSISDSKNHIGDSTNINGLVTPGDSVKPKQKFTDIDSSFAKENIENLTNLFIINGYADGTFRPHNSVTRAEFCKIVCLAFGFTPSINDKFEDVNSTDWFAPYTGTLSSFGIIRGDGVNFNPQGYITRQDAAVILGNALEFVGKKLRGSYNFSDDENISDYAKEKVSAMASMGYLKGDGVNFYPAESITRAETAALVDRIYTSLN